MMSKSKLVFCLAAVAFLVSCTSAPADPVTVENLETVSATVTAIDTKKRLISLRSSDGGGTTIEVPDEVRNLAQIKVGDQVVVRYYESIGAAVRPKGTPTDLTAVEEAAVLGRAEPGAKPGGGVGSVTTTTVAIQSVDKTNNTVTFSGPDGYVRVVQVKDPAAQKFIASLKAGDLVDLTFTEALAVTVESIPK
ncbi:MAG: hypothetical protein K0Q67_330 [Cellvibrio sp.]|nr:hypothetical protein [Cellvibrio sp.]